ncbi:MAG: hypothetical protein SFU27_01665 [Thermonemataceae bacterium]|nr:hypothetical protein [Thermonemataceae bacterium]
MAKANLELIRALRRTAEKLEKGAKYQWGHMGSCNCGNLAQELTHYTKEQIHAYALESRMGDWADQTSAFCGESKLPLDMVISTMLEAGLDTDDLIHLERLSDEKVLKRIPQTQLRELQKNKREDVIIYLKAWSDLLEEDFLASINLNNIFENEEIALY